MHSIPAALTWEFLRRGRWVLPGAFAGSLAFPLLIFSALAHDGALDPESPGIILMQVIMTQVALLGLGAGIFAAVGVPSRMFTLPVSTPGIVLSHLIPSGILAACLWSAGVGILNACLPLEWPALGPALFAAVVVPLVLATSWYSEKSVWLPVLLGAAAVVPFVWLKSRYGNPLSNPDHQWQHVTAGDGLFLAALGIAAYFIGVAGVARQRRHEPLSGPRFLEWIERLLDREPVENLRFCSAESAQLWVEWNSKAVMLPGMLVFVGAIAFLGWLLFSRNPTDLLRGVLGGGAMLPIFAGIVGLILGNFGPTDNNSVMGSWVASRPLTSTALANVVLKAQFLAVAITTVIWQLAFWVIMAIAGGEAPPQEFPPVGVAAANCLLPWAAASIGMLMCLTGHSAPIGIGFTASLISTMGLAMFIRWLGGEPACQTFLMGVLIVISVAVIFGTMLSFVIAIRRGLISVRVATKCGLAVALMLPVVAWLLSTHQSLHFVPALIAGAIAVWCVAPFPMAPLAVAWNRHR